MVNIAEFVALEKDIEVNGETVLSVVKGMGIFHDKAYEILERHGIKNPEPGQWYPQQAWLDAFKEISVLVGQNALWEIGKKIPENAQWPPHVKSVPQALGSIDIAYHMNHRKEGKVLFDPGTGTMEEGIGHYTFLRQTEREGRVVCDNPYPCSFDMGIIQAAADQFALKDEIIQFLHDESGCRKNGDKSCTYIVKW